MVRTTQFLTFGALLKARKLKKFTPESAAIIHAISASKKLHLTESRAKIRNHALRHDRLIQRHQSCQRYHCMFCNVRTNSAVVIVFPMDDWGSQIVSSSVVVFVCCGQTWLDLPARIESLQSD